MLLVVALACWLGWIVHRARVQREAVAAIVRVGGSVVYDYQWPDYDAKPPGPAWLRGLIGRDYFDTVVFVNADTPKADDAVVAQIGRLDRLRALGLQGSTVTDAGLAGLSGLRELRTLHLRAANVDGSGFRHLSGLRELRNLHLRKTPITDANLAHLVPLTAIENLSFQETRVGDAGMAQVARMVGLKQLTLGSSDVGDAGLRELTRCPRPLLVAHWPKTRITAEGIAAARRLAPSMAIVP